MRIDVPAEDDTPRVAPETHASEALASDGRGPSDRVAYAANYRSIVNRTYQDYLVVTSETASLQTHAVQLRGAVDANSSGDCSLTVEASDNSGCKFLHADADPLRAFGPASETHPAELEAAMARLDGEALK